ncbi:MAG: hypothetical protein IPK82_27535 [Polyangiaceae bacterium]|nr:hypothetical protein [Polyangiaceae bacterium]
MSRALRKAAPAAVFFGLLLSPAAALAWGTPEHIDICNKIAMPNVLANVNVNGHTPAEWCALPDYASSIADYVQNGACATFDQDEHWPAWAVAAKCATVLLENNNHFGGFAYSSWHYYHQIAKIAAQKYAASCTPGCDAAAFAIEGWALHYLADTFASGHAWNPLGDYETPEGSYWMTHSAEEKVPDAFLPPPGGINIFRRMLHDHLNSATLMLPNPVTFADAYNGPGVVGDHAWQDGLAPAQQVAWTLSRANASVWDILFELTGTQGMGACQISNICQPDYLKGYLDQGNAYNCVPFVSNQSFAQAFTDLGANSESYTYYGFCDTSTPTAHDCAWEDPGRAIPFWPGSLYYYIDNSSVIDSLGCNLGDPTVYDGGNCAVTKYNKNDILSAVCNAGAAPACSFTGDCDLPDPSVIGMGTGGAGGAGGSAGSAGSGAAGSGAGGSGAAGNAGNGGGLSGGDGGGGANGGQAGSDPPGGGKGCTCTTGGSSETGVGLWLFLAAASLTAARRRSTRKTSTT